MNSHTRQKVWKLHSLLGIILGLPLFIIFLAGSFAFYQNEAIHWTHAEMIEPIPETTPSLDSIVHEMSLKAGELKQVTFRVARPERPVTDIYWKNQGDEWSHYWNLPTSNQTIEATDHDADYLHFLVDLHYFDFLPYGRMMTGIIATLFFSIILTGVIYQWRGLKNDFKWSRLKKTGRGFWKNWHRTLSAVTMPFQAIYSATGAVLTIGLLASAPAIVLFFDGSQEKLEVAISPIEHVTSDQSSHHIQLDLARRKSEKIWGYQVETSLVQVISHEGKAPTIIVEGREKGFRFLRQHQIAFTADASVIQSAGPGEMLGAALIEGIVNLHFGIFGAFWIKIALGALGLVVAFSTAAGILILLQRHQSGKRARWLTILEALTYWVIAGFPLAIMVGLTTATIAIEYSVISFWLTLGVVFLILLIRRKTPQLHRYYILTGLVSWGALVSFAIKNYTSAFPLGSPHQEFVTIFSLCILGYGFLMFAIAYYINTRKTPQLPEKS
ncbi:PepSY-associated TM helix domain-containing protein [Rubritalea spongiae]|uniref:PepSY-associated TM helix domain-containing protein n=2 Tax=Rubritalea spongiae TaxID=430797 RepID=A0ABW5E545_9BACT